MGGATSDHMGLPSEYGGSADQAEELAAQLLETTTQQDATIVELRRQLELRDEVVEALKGERDRARTAAVQVRRDLEGALEELEAARAELADLRTGRRETYSRELGGDR